MPVSRSPLEFLRRNGLMPTPRSSLPRLDTARLRVHTIPLKPDQIDPGLVLDASGDPPPDRGITDVWPPPQEVH